MPALGRILALDVGDKRIGLAITDALGLTAQPLFTLHRKAGRSGLRAELKAIARFIRQHEVTTLVVGLPLYADGSPSPQSAKVQLFAEALFAEHPTLGHHLLDERLTTREAHALLDAAGSGPGSSSSSRRTGPADRIRRSQVIDQVAATLILQSYLATLGPPALLPEPDPPGQL